MDLALVVVILLAGVVEASIQTFSSSLVPVEKSLLSSERARFAAWFRAFYRRRTAILAGDRRLSYRDVQRMANGAAAYLRQVGVRFEDRVLIALPDTPEFAAVFFAILKCGAGGA